MTILKIIFIALLCAFVLYIAGLLLSKLIDDVLKKS